MKTMTQKVAAAAGIALILMLGPCAIPQTSRAQARAVMPDSLSASVVRFSLQWTGSPAQDVAHSLQSLISSAGRSTTPAEFSGTLNHLLEALIGNGYRRALIAPRDFTIHGDTLGCVLLVTPGPRACVSAQEFSGLVHTDTVWLRRLIAMPLNVPLTSAWINEARARLQSISCLRVTQAPEIVAAQSTTADSENVLLRWHLVESRPVRFDGMVAAGGQSSGGLSGRGSVQMAGLLRRDRSVSVNYERLQLATTQLRVSLAEAGAFAVPLDWGLSLDELQQYDHRQGIAANLRYGLGPAARWRLEGGMRWRKVTPGTTPIAPSRTTEFSMGISHLLRPNRGDEVFATSFQSELLATFSHRRQFAGPPEWRPESVDDRMMIKWELDHIISWSPVLSSRLSAAGRSWVSGADRLGPGDEWSLGGDERLRGYGDREIAAASGSWATLEIRARCGASTAISVFAEGAMLREFYSPDENPRTHKPYSSGLALWLLSPDRVGHLEFAWRDHAAWRDGLVRLRISQSW